MSLYRSSLRVLVVALFGALAACTTTPPAKEEKTLLIKPVPPAEKPPSTPTELLRPVSFASLPGWSEDDLRPMWPAFIGSCKVLSKRVGWQEPCSVALGVPAGDEAAIRLFFESFFQPHQLLNQDGSAEGLVTGYYEPLLKGARKKGGKYQTPLHRVPDDMLTIELSAQYPELQGMRLRGRLVGNKVMPYYSRGELSGRNHLAGKELLWVDDPIEAFFLQVQGSGRVQLAGSQEVVRVAYANQNGHPYKSIGRYLVNKGEFTLEQASAQRIKTWYAANPGRQQELLNANPSYVFFKEEPLPNPGVGPKGAMGIPLTAERSIAVDQRFVPLGTPVFLATTMPESKEILQRLVVAQDTGGAIKNPVRADYFWGFGAEAGAKAGKMKQRGHMWLLLPRTVGQNNK